MPELKPCPFCGSKQSDEYGLVYELNEEGFRIIWCWNCPVSFQDNGTMTDDELIEKWNTRIE